MEKDLKRSHSISIKMSESVYKRFAELAHDKDLPPSTMAYLIVKQYMESKLGGVTDATLFDLI